MYFHISSSASSLQVTDWPSWSFYRIFHSSQADNYNFNKFQTPALKVQNKNEKMTNIHSEALNSPCQLYIVICYVINREINNTYN